MRTKLASYLLAGVMAFATMLPSLGTIASASVIDSGMTNDDSPIIGIGDNTYGISSMTKPAFAVYLCGDSTLQDGDINGDGNCDDVDFQLASDIVNGVSSDGVPGVDYTWITRYRSSMNMVFFTPYTDISTDFAFVALGAESSRRASGYYLNTKSKLCVGQDELETDSTWKAWKTVFRHVSSFNPVGNGSDLKYGEQVYWGYQNYRASIEYDPEQEYKDLIVPLCNALGDSNKMVKEIKRRYENNMPVTLIIEAYFPNWNNTVYLSMHSIEQALEYFDAVPGAGEERFGYQKSGIGTEDNGIKSGMIPYGYYNVLTKAKDGYGMRRAFRPAYNSQYNLEDATNKSLVYDGSYGYGYATGSPTPSGLGYFSLCDAPSEKNVSIVVRKNITIDGTSDYVDTDELAKYFTAHISAPFQAQDLNAVLAAEGIDLTVSDTDQIQDLATALAKYLGSDTSTYMSKITRLNGRFLSKGYEAGYGRPTEDQATFAIDPDDASGTPMATFLFKAPTEFVTTSKGIEPCFYVIYETGTGNKISGLDTTWTANAVAIVRLKIEDGAYTWKCYNVKTDADNATVTTKSSKKETMTVIMNNAVAVTPKEIEVDINLDSAKTSLLDVDKYYLTNYAPEFGFTNNEQLIYTDTRSALPKSNSGFIYSWYRNNTDAPDALNFSLNEIVDGLEAKDNAVNKSETANTGTIGGLLTPVVDTLTEFTKTNGYTWNFALAKGVKNSFTVEKDYVRKYDVPKVYSSVSLDTAIAAAKAGSNNGNFGDAVTKVRLADGTEYSGTSLPTVGKTYKLDTDVTALATEQTAANLKTKLQTYSDYARDYAMYEAMVATSAYNVKEAMRFYSKAALALYKEANDLATKEVYEADTWNEPQDGCTRCGGTSTSTASSRVTKYNNDGKAKALAAESKIKEYSNYLKTLTGWEFDYKIAYKTKSYSYSSYSHCCCYCYRYCVSWHCHCGSTTGYRHNITDRTEYLTNGSSLSSAGVKINLGKTTTLSVAKLPGALQTLIDIVKNGAETTGAYNVGGIYANLVKDAQKMQTELADLEANRPYAEIHIISRYEATAKADDLYQKATVPEYMVAMWWKNQTPFVKGNTRLSTVLDWTPYSAASTSLVTNSSAKMVETNVSTSKTFLMDRLKDTAVEGASGSSYYVYDTSSASKTDKVYRPVYTFLWRNRPFIGTTDEFVEQLKSAGSKIKTVAQDKSSEARFVYTPGDYFVTNDTKIYTTNLDGIGYLTNDVGIWTSIWAMDDNNPTNTVLPVTTGDAKWENLPTNVLSSVTKAMTGAKVNTYVPKTGNISALGVETVTNTGYFVSHANTSNDGTSPLLNDVINNLSGKVYYSDTNFTQDAESYFFFGSKVSARLGATHAYYAPTQAESKNAMGLQSKLEVYASSVPYKTEAMFKHYNVGDAEGTEPLVPCSTFDPEDEDAWDNLSNAYGYYTRNIGTFKIYPLVKRAYYDSSYNIKYTYVVGQKAREIQSNVFYQVGIVGNATPTIVTNAPASGSMAAALGNGYGTSNVSYSGSGITITYDPNVSLLFQTYALEDEDIEKPYQSSWGNESWIAANNALSAHEEWLESIGGAKKNVDTGSSTEIGIWTIPYIAGCETALKETAGSDWVTGNWVLDQDGAKLALADNSDPNTQTVNIKLYVEGGELVGIHIPRNYKNAKGDIIQSGYYTQAGKVADDKTLTNVDASGDYKGWTTADLLSALTRNTAWNTSDIAKALRNIGITGTEGTCLLKKSFVNGVGAQIVEDFNGNLATGLDLGNGYSYNEYTYCLSLRVETTLFKLQPLVFTDKLPAEYGPATPADKASYFSDGYGFQASALLLKIGCAVDADGNHLSSEETGALVESSFGLGSFLGTTWRINRADTDGAQSNTVDLVIGNVDVTAAN